MDKNKTKSSLSGADELIEKSWKIYKKGFKTFIGIIFIPFLVSFLLTLISVPFGFITTIASLKFKPLLFLLPFLVIFFAVVAITLILWSHLALIYAINEKEKSPGIKESFLKTKSKILSYLWISTLCGLAVFFGLFLLIIPAIIFLVWFNFSAFVLVSEGLTGTKALAKSRELIKGNWFGVFFRMLAMLTITFLLLMFTYEIIKPPILQNLIQSLATPFSTIYFFLIYEELKKLKDKQNI